MLERNMEVPYEDPHCHCSVGRDPLCHPHQPILLHGHQKHQDYQIYHFHQTLVSIWYELGRKILLAHQKIIDRLAPFLLHLHKYYQ